MKTKTAKKPRPGPVRIANASTPPPIPLTSNPSLAAYESSFGDTFTLVGMDGPIKDKYALVQSRGWGDVDYVMIGKALYKPEHFYFNHGTMYRVGLAHVDMAPDLRASVVRYLDEWFFHVIPATPYLRRWEGSAADLQIGDSILHNGRWVLVTDIRPVLASDATVGLIVIPPDTQTPTETAIGKKVVLNCAGVRIALNTESLNQ